MLEEKKDIIYIEKIFFNEMLKTILIGIALMMILFFINPNFAKKIVLIANIIIIFSMMFLSMITFSFSENKFFTLSTVCYVIIGIFRIMEIMNLNNFFYLSNLDIRDFCKILEGLYAFLIIRYLRNIYISNENQGISVKKVNLMIVIIFILIFTLNFTEYKSLKELYYRIFVVMIFLKAIYYTLSFSFENKKRVNYFIIAISAFLISSILNFIELFYLDKFIIISFYSEIFSFFAYLMIHLALNHKLLNRPAESLFTEEFNRRQRLIELNNDINIKNKNLESTQIALKNVDEMFKNIYRNIQIPLVILSENSRVIYANEKFAELLEVQSLKKIINKNIFAFIDIREYLKDTNKSIGKKSIIENVRIKKDREKKGERVFNLNILQSEKNNVILLFYDITEEFKINHAKKEFEKKMLEEKIKNDFLSNISHDIKTPINVIYSAIQLENVLIKERKIEELKKYNNINKENILTITRLANNLIDSSRLSNNYITANMKIYNIVELVEDCCNCFIEYIRNKNLEFYFDTEEEEIYVSCDKELMERVIINIISNSIKYTTEGEISVLITIKNKKAIIEFKDTGIGINKELLDIVFDKYTMGKVNNNEMNKNTGIGLYVVNNLIKLQKGNIRLKSKEGRGTKIIIEFFLEENNGVLKNDII